MLDYSLASLQSKQSELEVSSFSVAGAGSSPLVVRDEVASVV